jgi:capsular exopolysaccharide synthesis family protein
LAIPILAFALTELFNNRVQSKKDIEDLCRIPLIAGIGHHTNGHDSLVVMAKPKSFIAECFRTLRSNLDFFLRGKDKSVIMITSSLSGEGKTFTTLNLATILALAGKKVIVIGADLRKPKLFSDFNLDNSIGLSNYLSGMATLEQVLQKTRIEGVDLISGGPVPPNPGELLMQATMKDLISKLKESYDFILLDTAPLGLVADALGLIEMVDHTIFMVRQNYTPRYFLTDFQDMIDSRGLGNISILFNDIKRTGPGYGYGYSYGYRYGYDGAGNGGYYEQ